MPMTRDHLRELWRKDRAAYRKRRPNTQVERRIAYLVETGRAAEAAVELESHNRELRDPVFEELDRLIAETETRRRA